MADSFVMPRGRHQGRRLSELSDWIVACIWMAYSDPNLKLSRTLKADITDECMYDLKRRFGSYAEADQFVAEVRDQFMNRRPTKPPKRHQTRKQPAKSQKHSKPKKSNAEHLADFERDREDYEMPCGTWITIPAGTTIEPDEICPFA